jgi:hypothetical protein
LTTGAFPRAPLGFPFESCCTYALYVLIHPWGEGKGEGSLVGLLRGPRFASWLWEGEAWRCYAA